jgi:hypothetical protein
MHQLSALDALFLQIETPETPMHVGSLMLLKLPPKQRGSFYPKFRKLIAGRMHLAPLFARRLAFVPLDLANPVWIDGVAVDLAYHIRHLRLPKPGTRAQLEAAVARLHEGVLDRDRPLWEFTLIEGLDDGQAALYSKIHHAALDGQGGVALAQAVLDMTPEGRSLAPAGKKERHLTPSTAKLLAAALRNSVAQYGRIIGAVPGAVRTAGALLGASQAKKAGAPSEQGSGMPALAGVEPGMPPAKAARALLKKIPGGIALGPRTALNVAIGAKRAFCTQRIALAEAKALARHFGAKLNDIVMAECAGALMRYLKRRYKALPAKPLIAAIPVSLRQPGDTTQSNQVTMMLVSLATHLTDARMRLAAILASSARAKALTGTMTGVVPTDLPSLGLPWLMSVVTPLYRLAVETNRIPVLANLVISNVPGPQQPLYLAGAQLTAYYPVSIVSHGLALNITIQSYDGWLDFGFIACAKNVPGMAHLADDLRAEHTTLMGAMAEDLDRAAGQASARAPAGTTPHRRRSANNKKGK